MRTFTSPLFAATMLYGRMLFACATSSDSNLRPIRRLIAKTVLNGFVIACRFAICPTSRSLSSVNPTTDGVVRLPSRFGSTCGVVTSTTDAQEFVVPRSIPRILAMDVRCYRDQPARGQMAERGGQGAEKRSSALRPPPSALVWVMVIIPHPPPPSPSPAAAGDRGGSSLSGEPRSRCAKGRTDLLRARRLRECWDRTARSILRSV